jgi:glutamate/tyrosine decarboxylase-like PLP-dependent enzyme/anti-sigma regulatory factor (Ser/Thr protein kinase)
MKIKRNDRMAAGESISAQPRATHTSWATGFGRDGVTALLEASPTQVPVDLKALFLGPKAENADLVEQMLLDVYRDYVFWRRNFHPEDRAVILPEDRGSQSYNAFVSQFQRELFALLGELKSDIPFFSPRYIGHMLADVSLPALVGYIATMLYNPNNVAWEASPVTTLLEIQVGRELAGMLGFGITSEELAATWGHITSGGTLANLESIWVAKAVKFLPVAVRQAAADLEVTGLTVGPAGRTLDEVTTWELVNLSPTEALDLKEQFVLRHIAQHPEMPAEEMLAQANDRLKEHNILSLGDHAFFSRLTGDDALRPGIIYAPQTMHYSWEKGPAAIGIGSRQVVPIPVDARYRTDMARLRQELERALQEHVPVIATVGVVGATEEGAVDPMHELVALRQEFAARGLSFSLHCDAAYGGYIDACFRSADGRFRDLAEMQREYAGWPPEEVYKSYAALKDVDSVTIDPHKLGFVPYPAGAIVFRDGRVKDLVAQEASYALGGRIVRQPGEIHIGKYILEGSKPGAAAAATFLSHRVVPLNETGYGAVLGQTLRIARTFHDRMQAFAKTMEAEFTLQLLVPPDTNILVYGFNPAGNDQLSVMNRFGQALYRELSIDPASPVQTRRFIVSHTELSYEVYNPSVLRAFLERMGVEEHYLVSPAELIQHRAAGAKGYDDAVVVFRTTLMNPFTLAPARGSKDYIHLFLETLLPLLRKARRTLDISAPLCIAARLESLADIRRFVRDRATVLDVDPATIADLVLAVDEAATNVITHGYQGQEGIVEIEVRREGNAVIAQVRDEAKPFDPTAAPPPDLTLPPEERAMEGMGIYMMRRNTDEMSHRLTLQRGNELTLVKRGIGT